MNAERYLHMLDSFVWPTVSGWDNIDDLIFMQDGAPPHFALTVRAWLDQHFSGRWLGRRGPHEWPPRSPDLTPCDFYLWGYTKRGSVQDKTSHIGRFGDKNPTSFECYPQWHSFKSCSFYPWSFNEASWSKWCIRWNMNIWSLLQILSNSTEQLYFLL